MNLKILNANVQEFITHHLNSDITKLILKGSSFSDISVQELANQIEAKKKATKKLPTWFNSNTVYYPKKIAIEQTSSEITANYKSKLLEGVSIVDITGGFGVDDFYFSKQFKTVVHCEINEELSKIVAYNYTQLNVKNIETVAQDGLSFLQTTNKNFDCIYVDPSRRNDIKGKVFLFKDCLPNIPENLDFLFSKTATILVKASPILDINSAINELKCVKTVYVVAVMNEVKELLFLLEKDYTKSIVVKTININKSNTEEFEFSYNSVSTSTFSSPKKYLYEPNAAILKSGAFLEVSSQLKVDKLDKHSHLYTSNELLNDFPGRKFKILHAIPYNKKELNKLLPTKKANITARNFPKSVNQIRKETNIKEGGNIFLFFTKTGNKNIILITEKATNSP